MSCIFQSSGVCLEWWYRVVFFGISHLGVPQLDGQYLTKITRQWSPGLPWHLQGKDDRHFLDRHQKWLRSPCHHSRPQWLRREHQGWLIQTVDRVVLGLFKDTLNDPLEDYLKLAMVITLNGIVFLHGFLLMVIRRDQIVYLYAMFLMSIYFEHDYCLHLYICAPKSLEGGNSKLPWTQNLQRKTQIGSFPKRIFSKRHQLSFGTAQSRHTSSAAWKCFSESLVVVVDGTPRKVSQGTGETRMKNGNQLMELEIPNNSLKKMGWKQQQMEM